MGRPDRPATLTYRSVLRSTLEAERKAYGFTLAIWGGATMAASVHGAASGVEGLAYVAGALASMGLVILFTQHSTATAEEPPSTGLSPGSVHVFSVAAAVGGAWLGARLFHPGWLAYLAAGSVAAMAYQLLVPLESLLVGRRA